MKNFTNSQIKDILLKEKSRCGYDLIRHKLITIEEYEKAQFNPILLLLEFNEKAVLEAHEDENGKLELIVMARDNKEDEWELYFGWGYKDNNQKIKIPRYLFDALNDLKDIGFDNYTILDQYMKGSELDNRIKNVIKYTQEEGFDKLLQALVNGYELKLSPEERVKEYYISTTDHIAKKTIENIAEILNINLS